MTAKTLRRAYQADLELELARQVHLPTRIVEERELVRVPEPVRRFLRESGLVGMSHASNARIVWRQMELRGAGAWMRMECEQVSFLREPVRLALMRSMIARCLPLDGYDRYRDGQGEMRMNLAGVVPVRRVRGHPMNASGLVTFLSEGLLTPTLLLEPNVHWFSLDAHSARAELAHAGLRVGGVFSFDHASGTARFETEDRFRDGPTPRRQRWSAEVRGFEPHKGLRLATQAGAFWHDDNGAFEYMRGAIESISFDVTDAQAKVHPHRFQLGRALSFRTR